MSAQGGNQCTPRNAEMDAVPKIKNCQRSRFLNFYYLQCGKELVEEFQIVSLQSDWTVLGDRLEGQNPL